MNPEQWLKYTVEHGHMPPGVPVPEPLYVSRSAEGYMRPVAGLEVPSIPLERRVAALGDLSDV
jgi:hypothetical protein